jgi:hypothetical protein
LIIYITIKDLQNNNSVNIAEDYDKAAKDIIDEINKLKPQTPATHTNGTNVIMINVGWKSNEIIPNLRIIQQHQNVKGFVTIHDPLADLEKAINEHDFIKAYSLGSTFFESVGKNILKKHFNQNKVQVGKDVFQTLSLQATIVMLYTHKLVNQKTYDYMMNINRVRNRHSIHGDITQKPDFDTLEEILEHMDKILVCAKELDTVYKQMGSSQGSP